MHSDRRVLVTGASGFLGAHVVAALISSNCFAFAGMRAGSDPWRLDRIGTEAERIVFDINWEEPLIAETLQSLNVCAIINCAAYGVNYRQQSFDEALSTNVSACWRLVNAASFIPGLRIVHVGSASEYGNSDKIIDERAPLSPVGLYGVTKAAGTTLLLEASRQKKIESCVVRPFGMYGPLEGDHRFIPLIMQKSRSQSYIELSPGEQIRDYCYVGDVAQGLVNIALIEGFPSNEIFNFCSGHPVRLKQLGNAAVKAAGGSETFIQWSALAYRPNEAMSFVGDPTKSQRLLGWQATTSIEAGLQTTAATL